MLRVQTSHRALIPALVIIGGLPLGCVGTRDVPPLPKQAKVPYGPKVYLVDNTFGVTPTGNMCTRLATVATTTTATIAAEDDLRDGDNALVPINLSEPHNCYVRVQPKTLVVDSVEVTNELFQLCVDSGACTTPDPSKGNKGQLCDSEKSFDTCPVVEVSHTAATNFCTWMGRRLPSAIEHVIIRQGLRGADPSALPVYPNGAALESQKPENCGDAVLGGLGCKRPVPSDPETPSGAAKNDVVSGAEDSKIFDLMGNVSEWAADLLPEKRGTATGLPWFCSGRLPAPAPGEAPQCPTNAVCVYGQYQPAGQPLGDYPVCIAFGSALRAISGAHGALFGGNFDDKAIDRYHTGIFARRVELNPDKDPARFYGFRCVGDIEAEDDTVTAATP